MLKKEIED